MAAQINAYELGENRRKEFFAFLLAFAMFFAYGIAYKIYSGWYAADSYVTTLLAFSYLDNGFCRRGLVGTIFSIVYRIFPAAKSVPQTS